MLSSSTLFWFLFEDSDSNNAQALQHERAMVDVYTKMKPDSFNSSCKQSWQPITRTSTVEGARFCPKTKIVMSLFQVVGQEDTGTTPKDEAVQASRTLAVQQQHLPPALQLLFPLQTGQQLLSSLWGGACSSTCCHTCWISPQLSRKGWGTGW
jgi:hypothetical protein